MQEENNSSSSSDVSVDPTEEMNLCARITGIVELVYLEGDHEMTLWQAKEDRGFCGIISSIILGFLNRNPYHIADSEALLKHWRVTKALDEFDRYKKEEQDPKVIENSNTAIEILNGLGVEHLSNYPLYEFTVVDANNSVWNLSNVSH